MVPLLLCPAVPPQIVNISSDITVNEGSSVTLMCLAFGRPEPTVTWRHLSGKGERRLGDLPVLSAGCRRCQLGKGMEEDGRGVRGFMCRLVLELGAVGDDAPFYHRARLRE